MLPVPHSCSQLVPGAWRLPRERWQHKSHWDGVCAWIEEEREERELNLLAHLLENTSKGTSLAFYSSLASAHLFSHFPAEPAFLGGLRAHTTCLWDAGWYTGCWCSLPVPFVGSPDVWKPLTASHIYHLAVPKDGHWKPTKPCMNSQYIECCSVAAVWLFRHRPEWHHPLDSQTPASVPWFACEAVSGWLRAAFQGTTFCNYKQMCWKCYLVGRARHMRREDTFIFPVILILPVGWWAHLCAHSGKRMKVV